jgi:hypothetical protein
MHRSLGAHHACVSVPGRADRYNDVKDLRSVTKKLLQRCSKGETHELHSLCTLREKRLFILRHQVVLSHSIMAFEWPI